MVNENSVRAIVVKVEAVATKWTELRALTGKSEAQVVSLEREMCLCLCLGTWNNIVIVLHLFTFYL